MDMGPILSSALATFSGMYGALGPRVIALVAVFFGLRIAWRLVRLLANAHRNEVGVLGQLKNQREGRMEARQAERERAARARQRRRRR